MRKKPFFVREDYPIFDVAKIMVRGPYRRLPVVKDGILTGIVTPYDILKYLNARAKLRGGLRVALLNGGQDAGDVGHGLRLPR